MDNDVLTYLILLGLIILIIGVFIFISIRLRRGGGSMTTISLGATDEFLNKDRSKASETIVNENAGKYFNIKNKNDENSFKHWIL
jgi:hypothetical protein